ncbi:MAG: hypothetical protein QOE76_3833 [Frankiales bacterium]|nr:hypothetical protein [Frankiales bacterium]
MVTASAQIHLEAVANLGRHQQHVVSRLQLAELGIRSDVVRDQVSAGRWQVYANRVVVLHGGPITRPQAHWVAVLSQPAGAALAGISAAIAQGLDWKSPEQIHVVVPAGARPRPRPGVTVHVSRRFDPIADVEFAVRPPCTHLDRSVIDAAAWAPNDRRACGVLCAAVQQRLTTVGQLQTAFTTAGLVHRHRLIGLTLGDVAGGAQSFAEIDFVRLARRAGLHAPARQALRRDADGRWRFLDVDFGFFTVEVDGALHLLPRRYWDDMRRQNALTLRGEHILRFPSVAIRIDPGSVVQQLRQAKDAWADRPVSRWMGHDPFSD